jgi:hypothetical protein
LEARPKASALLTWHALSSRVFNNRINRIGRAVCAQGVWLQLALAAAGALFAAKALARFAELDQAVTALWRHLVVGAPVSCGEGFTAAVAR